MHAAGAVCCRASRQERGRLGSGRCGTTVTACTRKGPALRAGLCLGVCKRLLRLRGVITRGRLECCHHTPRPLRCSSAPGVGCPPLALLCCFHGCGSRYSSAGMPMPAICHAPPRCYSAAPWCPNLWLHACCHAGGHRTAVHAGAARRMDADAIGRAPTGGGTPPVNVADLSRLQPAG